MAGKGFDAKAFLVNHTEKLVLGAAVLMVLFFLGGSQWSSYAGTPTEITDKVAKAKVELEKHDWPVEEKAKYEMTQDKIPKQRVHDFLLNPISVANYQMSTKFVATPWQGKEPLRDPALLTLEDALADAGKVLIERPIDPTKVEEEAESDKDADSKKKGKKKTAEPEVEEPATPSDEDDEFATSAGAAGEGLGQLGGAAMSPAIPGGGFEQSDGEGGFGAGALPGRASKGAPPAAMAGALGMALGLGGMGEMSGYPGGGGGGANVVREAQPYKFASVRAVFPLKEQIRRFQEATNSTTMEMASLLFEVIDFNLERQEQFGAGDHWTEWESVDTQAAIDVLGQALDHEAEIVQGTVTNNVMTMPLPTRIYGRWGQNVSHPRILNFELTPEQIQQEVEFQSRLIQLIKDDSKNNPEERPKLQKKGFSSVMGDTRALQSQALGGSAYGSMGGSMPGMSPGSMMGNSKRGGMGAMGSAQSMPGGGQRANAPTGPSVDIMKKLLETDDQDAQGKALKEYIKKRVTADGELLLFRYLDFDVDPGKTYRYRVRLVLNNPNFGHLASEANGEAGVVEGETRTTAWSNVTKPVTIERDVYYFVKDVDSKRGNKTRMSVFQWDTKLGTTVNAEIDLYPGQHIGGTTEAHVIDPAKSKVEDAKKYTFVSSDTLVDTHADISLDRTVHKDLKLPGGSNGEARLPEEVLVVQMGELAVIDPIRQRALKDRLEKSQKAQDKSFESLSDEAGAGAGMMMGAGGGDMAESYGMGSGKKGGKGGRSANPLSGRGGMGLPGGGMGMGGMGGMPGMSMPGGEGAKPGRGKRK